MKKVIFMVDSSGSISLDDTLRVGQINDLLRDAVRKCIDKGTTDISIICYSDKARVYWNYTEDTKFFYDIPESKFGGRSNLGQAYNYIKNEFIVKSRIPLSNCVIVLISDGEATDNYRKYLKLLDGNNQSKRIALSIGTSNATTSHHASGYDMEFKHGISDRDGFLNKLGDVL